MIMEGFGIKYTNDGICYIANKGISISCIIQEAKKYGIGSLVIECEINDIYNFNLPAIIWWKQRHFMVIYYIDKNYVYLADPANGILQMEFETFCNGWYKDNSRGVIVLFEDERRKITAQ